MRLGSVKNHKGLAVYGGLLETARVFGGFIRTNHVYRGYIRAIGIISACGG